MPLSHLIINDTPVPFHWWEWGRADLPPLVLLHGFMGRGDDWATVAEALASAYRVIAPDLPFHGKSVLPDALLAKPPDFDAVMAALATWLVELYPEPIPVVGYSMGGRLALAIAVEFSAPISYLILESSSPGIPTEHGRKKRRQSDAEVAAQITGSDLEAFLRAWYAAPLWGSLTAHPKFEDLIERRKQNDPLQLATALRVLGTGNQPSYWGQLENLNLPVLLLAGEFDHRYIHIMDTMRRQLPQAYFQIVPQSGHNIHFEQPEIFIKLVRNFLMD